MPHSLAQIFTDPEVAAELRERFKDRVSPSLETFYEVRISQSELEALQKCGDPQTVISVALRAYLSRYEQSGKLMPQPSNPRGQALYQSSEVVHSLTWAMPFTWQCFPWRPGKVAESHIRAAIREFIAKNCLLPDKIEPGMLPKRHQTVISYFLKPSEMEFLKWHCKRPYGDAELSDVIHVAVSEYYDRHGHQNLFAPEGSHAGEKEFYWRTREPYSWILPPNHVGHWVSQAIRSFIYKQISWEDED